MRTHKSIAFVHAQPFSLEIGNNLPLNPQTNFPSLPKHPPNQTTSTTHAYPTFPLPISFTPHTIDRDVTSQLNRWFCCLQMSAFQFSYIYSSPLWMKIQKKKWNLPFYSTHNHTDNERDSCAIIQLKKQFSVKPKVLFLLFSTFHSSKNNSYHVTLVCIYFPKTQDALVCTYPCINAHWTASHFSYTLDTTHIRLDCNPHATSHFSWIDGTEIT